MVLMMAAAVAVEPEALMVPEIMDHLHQQPKAAQVEPVITVQVEPVVLAVMVVLAAMALQMP